MDNCVATPNADQADADNDGEGDACEIVSTVGTGTPGYWKNHPEAWPVTVITVGGVSYTREEAIPMLKQAGGDKSSTLFRALVSAKLNVLNGAESSCINGAIDTADAWFVTYGPVGSKIKGNSAAWRAGEPLNDTLDAYNNGQLCAPHRD